MLRVWSLGFRTCASARSLKALSPCFFSTSLTMPCTTLHCASTASGLTESQCVATRSTAAPGTAACRASRGSTTSRWNCGGEKGLGLGS